MIMKTCCSCLLVGEFVDGVVVCLVWKEGMRERERSRMWYELRIDLESRRMMW